MARIFVRHTVVLKIFSVLQLSAVSAYFLIIAIPQVTGTEPLAPEGTEKHWVSTLFDNFTAAADALQWSDIRVVSNWRIQQHAQSKEYRILDSDDRVIVEATPRRLQCLFFRTHESGRHCSC